jgi:hypothetical protein
VWHGVEDAQGSVNETLSVIVDGRTGGPPLRTTLDSLFAQTHPPDEVLVLAGTGNQYLSAVLPHTLRIVTASRCRAGAAGWNDAAGQTRGRYLAFVDAGAIWDPSFAEAHVSFLEAHPKCSALVAGRAEDVRRSAHLNLLALIAHTPATCLSATLIRRDTFVEAGGFDETIRERYDLDLHLRMARHGHVLAIRNAPLGMPPPSKVVVDKSVADIEAAVSVLERFSTRHALPPDIRTALRIRIMRLIDRLELEQARCRILEGHFDAAYFHLDAARNPSLSVRLAKMLLRVMPRLVRAMYRHVPALAHLR